jgi:hypothetical protein
MYRVFVCEENNNRIGIGVELANGCVAGAIDEPFEQMVQQLQMAIRNDNLEEITTAIEEAPVLTRAQFMEVVNRCRMLADFSQQCDDIPNLPMTIRDTPISYEEMEEEFWEINPAFKEMLEQLLDQETPVLEVEVVEPDAIIDNNGTIQLIESAIENFNPEEDNIEDNDVLFKLAQDNDNLHRKRVGLLPDPNLNYEIDEETHESLFGRLMRKLFKR